MVFRKISDDIKQRALFLTEHPELVSSVEDALGVSTSSIKRWQAVYDKYGTFAAPHTSVGRPRLMNGMERERLRNFLIGSPEQYLDEIREWIAVELDIPMAHTTVYDNIRECGLTHKKLRLRAVQRDEEAILEWKAEVAEMYSVEQLVSIDESSKDGRTLYRTHGWALTGQTPVRTVDFPRGDRWTLLPALTVNGYIAKRVLEGSVDATDFLEFILEDVLPLMNPFPLPQSVILMDNCAIHKLDILRRSVEEKGCRICFLPPYAPELNPIEESFATVKAALRREFRRLGQMAGDEAVLAACETVTGMKAKGWFRHSGYY